MVLSIFLASFSNFPKKSRILELFSNKLCFKTTATTENGRHKKSNFDIIA